MAHTDPVRVGVLSLHNSKETKAILNAVADLGHDPYWLRDTNTAVQLKDGQVYFDPEVDVIANRLLLSKSDHPAEALGLALTYDGVIPVLNRPSATLTAIHKFATATALATADLPVPDALLALAADRLNADRDVFGSPDNQAVYKSAIGTNGGGTTKVNLADPLEPRVGHHHAFLQRLIDPESDQSSDLRVYVVGDQVIGVMTRTAPDDDWRTNVALGGTVTDAIDSVPDEVLHLARKATRVIGLDYAGVDLIEGDDGWTILEVNPTAGFKGLFDATGRSPAPYIAQLAIETAGGEVESHRVDDLATTLDDSVPACKPRRTRDQSDEPVTIGFTEEVRVAGTTDATTVVAKTDTGAARTSIDTAVAADIGAGPVQDLTTVKSGASKTQRTRPVVDVVIGLGGKQQTVAASIEDRGHMEYPVLLGRDILTDYHIDIEQRVADSPSADASTEEE